MTMFDSGGPVHQVISEQNLVLAAFGALGGMVRSAALKTTWKEGLRVTFIGCATSFGFGRLAPVIITKIYDVDIPDKVSDSFGVICACAFFVGLAAVTLIERFVIAGKPDAPGTDLSPPKV
jgi:hypothetical protein